MRIATDNLTISNGAMTADRTSEVILLDHQYGYSVQIAWTGTPTGDFTLEASNDNTTFITVSGSTVAAGGGAGNHLWEVDVAMYRYVRVKYTFTSGTGTWTQALSYSKGM